jgi:murein DD-endopeptidase MepM/ murein hydrolase activator NlpD
MKEKRFIYVILFLIILIFDVLMMEQIKKTAEYMVPFDATAFETVLRNQQIPADVREKLISYGSDETNQLADYMFAYLYSGLTDKTDLERSIQYLKKRYPNEYKQYVAYEEAIWSDASYFPVAESINNTQATVKFEDSWMQSRTFGGTRGHEGCDIMASINQRGYYPIVSVSDGTIENIGWLSQGGYRIGIRSKHGAYFYYAHLYDYARDFKKGDVVKAGELIGFMGDSGYSDVVGTVGNFDVHLHFGIYLNDPAKKEFSVNSYCILDQIKNKRYACTY